MAPSKLKLNTAVDKTKAEQNGNIVLPKCVILPLNIHILTHPAHTHTCEESLKKLFLKVKSWCAVVRHIR